MLDKLTRGIGGLRRGHGHFQASAGFGFEEHKEFSSRVESSGGFVDRQARYNHRTGNHGRPPMHVWDEEDSDSDVEEFFESSRTQHTTALPQPLHMNFRPPPPVTQPHHNGKMGKIGNGLQQGHEIHGMKHQGGHGIQHHDIHGMQHQGGHGMQHQGMHGMQHQGGHGMQHQGGHGMQHQGMHGMQHQGMHGMQHQGGHGMQHQGGHGMQHQGMHGMQHQGGHGMEHQGGHGMQHQDMHGMQHQGRHGMQHQGGHEMQHQGMHGMQHQGGHRIQHQGMHGMQHPGGVVVNATENWRVSKITGQKLGWGGKGL